jgi:hypothetical protein
MRKERGISSPFEPYFQDEVISELGFSLTDKVRPPLLYLQ